MTQANNAPNEGPNHRLSLRKFDAAELIKDSKLRYLYYKSERISTALYLVTSHLREEEPLKNSLREGGLSLLSLFHELINFSLQGGKIDEWVSEISSSLLDIHSKLGISSSVRLIDAGHVELIQREIIYLYQGFREGGEDVFVLPESFFEVDEPQNLPRNSSASRGVNNLKAEDSENINKAKQETFKNIKPKPDDKKSDKANNRRNKIISFLKDNGKSSINDIKKGIGSGFSKKTLQRDLNTLAEEGLISKLGSKRWSTYLLNE